MLDCIILAGGLGTRLKPITKDIPKPMALIDGIPFLQWQFDYLISQGFRRVILSVGYKCEYIEDYFGTSYRQLELVYSREDRQLGTGGGVLNSLDYVHKDYVAILNGDTYFPINFHNLRDFIQDENPVNMIVTAFVSNKDGQYGSVEVTDKNKLLQLKSSNAKIGELSNAGVYICRKNCLIEVGKYFSRFEQISFESEVIPRILSHGFEIDVVQFDGVFIDIGTPEDYKRAFEVLQSYNKGT